MEERLHELLLTEQLSQAPAARTDLRADFESVDDAEQPMSIARHLMPLIERSVRAAPGPRGVCAKGLVRLVGS